MSKDHLIPYGKQQNSHFEYRYMKIGALYKCINTHVFPIIL